MPHVNTDSRTIKELDNKLKHISKMLDETRKLADDYRKAAYFTYEYDNSEWPKPKDLITPNDAAAINRFHNHNTDPLHIAVIEMAIHLRELFNEGKLSETARDWYSAPLYATGLVSPYSDTSTLKEQLEFKRAVPFTPGQDLMLEMPPTHEPRYTEAVTAERDWHRKMEQDRAADEAQDARMIHLMSTRTRGGKRSRKPLGKRTRKSKSNSNKSVAAAIKDIPLLKARADFAALKAVPCADINQAAKIGNAAMDHYFFRHRLAAKTKRDISYYDWIKTDWKRNEAELRLYRFNLAQGKTPEKARYGVFRLYYGAIHGFKPIIAKWMYCTYQPRTAVLDFSAGWGGRCLGAMALGIPYIGIDTNKDLRPAYERMVKELDSDSNSKSNSNSKVTMRFQDAAATDFSRFKYDMVFTSPPYFKTVKPIEGYAHMPNYKDRADFNARFLFPVVRSTYAHLARGGTYALNIPDDMYDEIKAAGILPPLLAKHRLFLQPRFAKGNPKHPDVQYKEHIYVWKKP